MTGRRRIQSALGAAALALSLLGCGSGGDDSASPVPGPSAPPVVTAPAISLVAGAIGGPGNLEGAGELARFDSPSAVALDASGAVDVVDAGNLRLRRVTAAGEVTFLAGVDTPGDVNFNHPQRDGGPGTASFNRPVDAAIDTARGLLYVTDFDRVRRVTLAGTVDTVFFNQFPGLAFSPFVSAVAVGADGTLFVAAGTVGGSGLRSCCIPAAVYRFPLDGVPALLAGNPTATGTTDAQGAAARFQAAARIAVDRAGNVLVADASALRRITPDATVTTLAGSAAAAGFADGTGAQARFGRFLGIAVDADGNVLVADADNRAIRRVTPAGAVSTLYGDVPFAAGRPPGITVDASGRIFYTTAHAVLTAQPGNQARVLAGTMQPATDGFFADNVARIRDSQGNLFAVTPEGAVRKYAPDGKRVAFGPAAGDLLAQPPAGGLFRRVLAVDHQDNLSLSYLTFQGFAPVGGTIMKVTPAGQVSVRAASNAASPVPFQPVAMAFDAADNLFFIDDVGPAIRRLAADGTLTTVGDLSGTPEVTTGSLRFGLAIDAAGGIYMNSDTRCVIYKLDAAGRPQPFAGQLDQCGDVDGPRGQALLRSPQPPMIDAAGNLYVAQTHTIRRVAPDGSVTTIAGQAGQVGTRPGPLPGSLASLPARSLWLGADRALHGVAGAALLRIPLP